MSVPGVPNIIRLDFSETFFVFDGDAGLHQRQTEHGGKEELDETEQEEMRTGEGLQ